MAIELHTPRLLLRQWQPSDHETFVAMGQDADVMHYFPALQTRGDSLALIARVSIHLDEHDYSLWAVQRKDNGKFIGFTGLWKPTFESFFTPCVEIGWRLSKENWHQGFAQEAAKAVLQYGFDILGLNEIYSFTATVNLPSINVMQKIGMTYIGEFEHPRVPKGHWLRTHVVYRVERTV